MSSPPRLLPLMEPDKEDPGTLLPTDRLALEIALKCLRHLEVVKLSASPEARALATSSSSSSSSVGDLDKGEENTSSNSLSKVENSDLAASPHANGGESGENDDDGLDALAETADPAVSTKATLSSILRGASFPPFTNVKELRRKLVEARNEGGFEAYSLDDEDPVAIVGLLMTELRDSPESIIPYALHEDFLAIASNAMEFASREAHMENSPTASPITGVENVNMSSSTSSPALDGEGALLSSSNAFTTTEEGTDSSSNSDLGSRATSSLDKPQRNEQESEKSVSPRSPPSLTISIPEMEPSTPPRINTSPDDDSDSSSEDSTSSSSSEDDREFQRFAATLPHVSRRQVLRLLSRVEPLARRGVLRRLLGFLVPFVEEGAEGSQDASYDICGVFAPLLARIQGSAYMSVRHRLELPKLRIVLGAMISMFQSGDGGIANVLTEETPRVSPGSSPAHVDTSTSQALNSSSINSNIFSFANNGVSNNNNNNNNSAGGVNNNNVSAMGKIGGSAKTVGKSPSPSGAALMGNPARHVRRKTPPRAPTLELLTRRRQEIEAAEAAAVLAAESVLSLTSPSFDEWINGESGIPVPVAASSTVSASTASSTSSSSTTAGSASSSTTPGLSPAHRTWATKETITKEKRALKIRISKWEREFEEAKGRRITREDKMQNKGVYTAYGCLQSVLELISRDTPTDSPEFLLAEKKALQTTLKLFENDFQSEKGRAIETAADVVPRQFEYQRYAELKRILGA